MHVIIGQFLISGQVVDDFRQSTSNKREGERNKLLENFHGLFWAQSQLSDGETLIGLAVGVVWKTHVIEAPLAPTTSSGHRVSCLMVKPWLGSGSGVEETCY